MSAPSQLQRFGNDIWIADGPNVRFAGARLPTRMIVVKLNDGVLWINSPVSAPSGLLEEIDALGPVRHLVAPTRLHLWRLERWHARYPQALLWGPPKIARSYAHLAPAGLLGDVPPAAWATDFEQVVFRGNALIEEVEFYHKPSRTLIVTDFIQNYRAEPGDLIGNTLKAIGGVLGGGVPIDIRLTFTARKVARRSLARLLSWPFDALIIAHGDCVEFAAKAFVEQAFDWLSRSRRSSAGAP